MTHKCISSDNITAIKPNKVLLKGQIGNKIVFLSLVFIAVIIMSCQPTAETASVPIPTNTFNDDGSINVYIEISAGTNVKYELDKEENVLIPEQIEGQDRKIDFLPYPGNYGFVVSTLMDKDEGGDGDAMDVIILSDTRPNGSVMKVLPIGVLMLSDAGEIDHKIIAVPFEASERTINIEKFSTFITRYNAAQMIVQEWFLNYKGVGKMKLLGWKDEQYALSEIRKWSQDK